MTAVASGSGVSAFAAEGDGSSAVDQIFALMRSEERWDYDLAKLRELQLAAMTERLRSRRETIRTLDQLADQVGLDTIETLEDASSLLFTGVSYKAYPEVFVSKRQWAKLLRWLDHMATPDLSRIDVADAADLDEFVIRLTAAWLPGADDERYERQVLTAAANQSRHGTRRRERRCELRVEPWPGPKAAPRRLLSRKVGWSVPRDIDAPSHNSGLRTPRYGALAL